NVHKAAAAPSQAAQTTASAANKRGASGPSPRGPMIPGGGESRGPMGGGMPMGMGGGGSTEKKYTFNVGIFFQNRLNNVNLAPPIGNLSSPLFGQSQSV